MRYLFILIIILLFGCRHNGVDKPRPSDTQLNKDERNWEYLYAIELQNALNNQDDMAFYFFWPLYLEARYENKLKIYEEKKTK